MSKRIALILALAWVPAACADRSAPADPQELRAALMQVDRDFNRATQERGVEGWVSFFAEDGAIIGEGVGEIRGIEAIREAVAHLSDPAFTLTWDPIRADASASGDLGYTVGRYTSRRVGEDGDVTVGEGLYVSIWRLQADGRWRVVMDLGNPTDDSEDSNTGRN
jgi:ketosteroid isomerase-like protein